MRFWATGCHRMVTFLDSLVAFVATASLPFLYLIHTLSTGHCPLSGRQQERNVMVRSTGLTDKELLSVNISGLHSPQDCTNESISVKLFHLASPTLITIISNYTLPEIWDLN